ncbi:MAG TPA: ABC transporter permease, partial [Alphaproteobacteria bacterium]|nr:ABC transporter permease [Alphaproteobacteria bacterium]
MSAATMTPSTAPVVRETAIRRDLKAPIALDVFAIVALILAFFAPRPGESTFGLSTSADAIQLAPIVVHASTAVTVIAIILAGLAVVAHIIAARGARGRVPLWLIAVFGVLFLVAFLAWAAAGSRAIPVPGLLVGALALSTPLIFGALGGVIGERAGVVNVAIEGQLLLGAFSAAFVGSLTKQPVLGLLAAMVGSVL